MSTKLRELSRTVAPRIDDERFSVLLHRFGPELLERGLLTIATSRIGEQYRRDPSLFEDLLRIFAQQGQVVEPSAEDR